MLWAEDLRVGIYVGQASKEKENPLVICDDWLTDLGI